MEKGFGKKLRGLVLPIAFQQFMLAAVSASDAVMLGMLNQDAMAGISLASQVQFVFSLYLSAMTIGASIFAAQYWGNGNREAVERILGLALKLATPASSGFTLVTALIPQGAMRIFANEPTPITNGAA